MPQNQAADNFQTTLAAAATSSQTTLDLASIAGAPSYPYLLALTPSGGSVPFSPYEVVQVTSLSSGTTVNVVRAVQGTASAWNSGDTAANAFTAGDANGLMQKNWIPDFSGMDAYQILTWETASSSGGGVLVGTPNWNGTAFETQTTANSYVGVIGQGMNTVYTGVLVGNVPDPSIANGCAVKVLFNIGSLPAAVGDAVLFRLTQSYSLGSGQGVEVAFGGSLTTSLYDAGTTSASGVSIADTGLHELFMVFSPSATDIYIDGTKAGSLGAIGGSPPFYFHAYAANGAAGDNVTVGIAGAWILQSRTAI